MGVCDGAEEEAPRRLGMHWQQHQRNPECHVGPAHDPSRDHSPNLPLHPSPSSSSSPSSSMGDEELAGVLGSGGSNFSVSSDRSTPNSIDGLRSHRQSPGESPDSEVVGRTMCVYGRPGGGCPSGANPFALGIRFAGCGASPPYDAHHRPPGFRQQQHQHHHHHHLQPHHPLLPPQDVRQKQPSPHHRFREGPRIQHAVPPPAQPLQGTALQRPMHLPLPPSCPSTDMPEDGAAAVGGGRGEGKRGGCFPSEGGRSSAAAAECAKMGEWEGGRGRSWGGEDEEEAMCAGCGRRISDRFYLMAVERRWHASCLQCNQCWRALDGDVTCFSRGGHIYCKRDYYMLFGVKRCARCHDPITSSELVMRARDLVFHVRCFTCAACGTPLAKGDHFGMRSTSVFCRLHLGGAEEAPGSKTEGAVQEEAGGRGSPGNRPPPPLVIAAGEGGASFPSAAPDTEYAPHAEERRLRLRGTPPTSPGGAPTAAHLAAHLPAMGVPQEGMRGDGTSEVPFYNGVGTVSVARQKGRPRKRKPKDLESLTANLDLNTDPYLDVGGYVSRGPGSGSPGGGVGHQMGGQQQQRTKRMRTSFKHHQLRTMKSYFAINHNPDAKDLKQLSQKTGLPKRVLQVWFQNARAKWRRMMLKQEGSKCSSDKSSPSSVPPPSLLLSLPSGPSPPPSFHHELPRHAPPSSHGHVPASAAPIALSAGHRPDEGEEDASPERQQRQRFLGGPAHSPLDRP